LTLLLDTSVLFWWLIDEARLSAPAYAAIKATDVHQADTGRLPRLCSPTEPPEQRRARLPLRHAPLAEASAVPGVRPPHGCASAGRSAITRMRQSW
jgi:hypothetical protein